VAGKRNDANDTRASAVAALVQAPAGDLAAHRADLQAAAQSTGMTPNEIEGVLNSRADLPRQLLAAERDAVLALLEREDFPGRDDLVAQFRSARVVGYCGCGCATVHLAVDGDSPRAQQTRGPIPAEATVLDADGEPIGGVLVFLDEGRLSLLEIYSHDDPISPFPPREQLRPEIIDRR
jgi:hypothetical protein